MIELLAAMAVLMLLVALLARVFGAASFAWRSGNKRIESNNSGRIAMEFLSRDLSGLLVDKNAPNMYLESDATNVLGMLSDEIFVVSLSHRAEFRNGRKFRDAHLVHYAVKEMPGSTNRYGLYRWVVEDPESDSFLAAYSDPLWYENLVDDVPTDLNAGLIAENVRTLEIFITPVGETSPRNDYRYDVHGPPAVIDVHLEVFAEEDAILASVLQNNDDFLHASTRRYATRIYMQNQSGYADD